MANEKAQLLLVGTGYMAKEYAKVLKGQGIDFIVVGRGDSGCRTFEQETGIPAIAGGIEGFLNESRKSIQTAILCVNVEESANCALRLLKNGVQRILAEKPTGLYPEELESICTEADRAGAQVFVGYNRRFYASAQKAKEIIKEDGGVSSYHFEFTEWSHTIAPLNFDQKVKDNWLIANSSHVIDLACFLGGKPEHMTSYTKDTVSWANCSAVYAGAGESENGALFTYYANWNAPGRWGVEILTRKHKLYLRPLEKLQIQNIGSVQLEDVELMDELDKEYKPGLYQQVKAFLECESQVHPDLIDIRGQLEMMKIFRQISGLK